VGSAPDFRSFRALLAALGIVVSAVAAAEPAPVQPEAPPQAVSATTLAERARAVLEAHCAACRERHADGGTLDLAGLATDLALVVPRRPDQSHAYQQLLAIQAAAFGKTQAEGALPSPAAADIEAVRDWIESLPPRDAGCRDRTIVTPGDTERLIDGWVASVGVAEAKDTRFVSLVHLWNACADAADLAQYRGATEVLLAGLARRREPIETETVGDESALLAVRLSALAILPAEWDRLRSAAPGGPDADAIPADWLAAFLLDNADEAAGADDPAFDVRFDGAGLRMVEKLAEAWNGEVDLVRAAAERGLAPRALALKLAELGEDHIRAAMRLRYGSVPRAAWDNLARALDGTASVPTPWKRDTAEVEIDVLISTDKPFYRPRDLLTAEVTVSRACHLTLISVDRDGRALVLFPNELEQDNLIPPGVTARIPGRDAGYQLRLDMAGEEELVAVCERASRRLEGVSYDYERQRFASLGDWRAFLRGLPEREKEIMAGETSQANRRRRRGRNEQPATPAPVAAEDAASGRAAITLTIDLAGGR
jgi:hypothetical protein